MILPPKRLFYTASILTVFLTLTGALPPLIDAATSGDLQAVNRLVDSGVDVNQVGLFDWSALMFTSCFGHVAIVKFLLENNAYLHGRDSDGNTSLIWAARRGHVEVLKLLVERGAILDDENGEGATPLMDASSYGRFHAVQFLLNQGADPSADPNHKSTNSGRTALKEAASKGLSILFLCYCWRARTSMMSIEAVNRQFFIHIHKVTLKAPKCS
jgi:ankyrin repeat protein